MKAAGREPLVAVLRLQAVLALAPAPRLRIERGAAPDDPRAAGSPAVPSRRDVEWCANGWPDGCEAEPD
jgi:hypothetical protein